MPFCSLVLSCLSHHKGKWWPMVGRATGCLPPAPVTAPSRGSHCCQQRTSGSCPPRAGQPGPPRAGEGAFLSFPLLPQQRLRSAEKQRQRTGVQHCVCELSLTARPAPRDPAASQGRGCQDLRPWGFSRAALHLPVMLSPLCLYDPELPFTRASPARCSQQPTWPLGVAVVVAVTLSLDFGIPPEQLIYPFNQCL